MNSGHKNKDPEFLSREDINAYRSTSDERIKNKIEKKSLNSEFESDALEGWSTTQLTGESLKRLDRKFARKWGFVQLTTGIVGVISIVAAFYFLTKEEKNPELISPQKTILSYERTDIVLPEKIESMTELPEKKQINVKTVQRDFEIQKTEELKTEQKTDQFIDELPIRHVEEAPHPAKPIKEEINGKEIYLSDLKVLDYRAYRSKPAIQTKQIELTGTPANQSEPGQQSEEYTWRNVDVPYIEYLDKTMEIFARGNNKKALARFEEIIKTYPDDLNALFYAGLCYYNLQQYDKAISSFDNCLDLKYVNFNEEAYWYIAKAYLAKKDTTKAKEILLEIKNAGGYYSKQAEKLLK